jgi:hypothetical protein
MTKSEQITKRGHVLAGRGGGHREPRRIRLQSQAAEIGHLHGDHVAHFGFPKDVWLDLFDQGRIDYHPVFPGKPGYGARRIESDDDLRDVIELMRLNYDRVVARHGVPVRGG